MSDTKPSVGQTLLMRWQAESAVLFGTGASVRHWTAMSRDIDAAIRLHAQHAWTTAARQMRDECASALRRCSRPAEADIVADVPLPLPPRATPLAADAGAQPSDAAIEQARREGAEAMCAFVVGQIRGSPDAPCTPYAEGWEDALTNLRIKMSTASPGDAS